MSEARVKVTAEAELTPAQVAECFWELSSEEQALFFKRLDEIAGADLGTQSIYTREACADMARRGDYAALNAMQRLGGCAFKFGLVDERLDKWGIPTRLSQMRA